MVEKKLIKKVEDTGNKKNNLLYVTTHGKEVYPILNRELHYSTQVALSGLSEVEVVQIENLLERVSQNIVDNWIDVKKGKKRIY